MFNHSNGEQKPEVFMTYRDFYDIYTDYNHLYRSNKNNNNFLLLSAKAHFIKEEYVKCIEIIQLIPLNFSSKILYERQTLLFKSLYLSNQIDIDVETLQKVVNDYERERNRCPGPKLTKFHDDEVKELLETVVRGRNVQRQAQKIRIEELKEQIKREQSKKSFEGLPCYLISEHWNQSFLAYVQPSPTVSLTVRPQLPPPITNFELINHIFELEPHQKSQHQFLNKIMFPLEETKNYHVIGKKHWEILINLFGGYEVKRFYNTTNNNKIQGGDNLIRTLVEFSKIPYIIQFQSNSFYEKSILPTLNQKFGFGQLKEETRNGDYKIIQPGRVEQKVNKMKYVSIDANSIKTVSPAEEIRRKKILELYDLEKYDALECEKGNTVGLANLGNTCYMNSALQFLSNLKILSIYFLQNRYLSKLNLSSSNKDGSYGYLTCSYADLLKRLWSNNSSNQNNSNTYSYSRSRSIDPTLFKKTFSDRFPHFEGYEQQDAQEFLMFLLNCLHDDLNEKSQLNLHSRESTSGKEFNLVKHTSINHYNKHNKSIISDLFHGFHYEEIMCEECGYKSVRFEDNLMIHIQVPQCSDTKILIFLVKNSDLSKAEKYEAYTKGKSKLKHLMEDIKAYLQNGNEAEYVPFLFTEGDNKQCEELSENEDMKDILKSIDKSKLLFVYETPKCKDDEVKILISYSYQNAGKDLQDGFTRIMNIKKDLLSEERNQELCSYIHSQTSKSIYNPISHLTTKTSKSKVYSYSIEVHNKTKQTNYTNEHTNKIINKTENEEVLTLAGCFDKMRKQEKIEGWSCERCKCVRNACKTDKIYSTGKYLAIQLKRFTEKGKITTKIDYPLEGLSMKNYIDPEVYKPNEFTYHLQSVIVHTGNLNSGHYTCISRKHNSNKGNNRNSPNNTNDNFKNTHSEWLKYDDEIVTEIDSKYVIDENAYILLYEMVDGVDMYVSGMNKI